MSSTSDIELAINASTASSPERLHSPLLDRNSYHQPNGKQRFHVRLPQEVWLLIISHASSESLKALRLTSRSTEAAATPRLFAHLAVSPNENSVSRAKQIANSRHLAHYVTSLTWYALRLDDKFRDFDKFRQEVLRRRALYMAKRLGASRISRSTSCMTDSMETDEPDRATIANMYGCYVEELESQNAYLGAYTFSHLRHICQKLDNLHTISCYEDHAGINDLDNYLSRKTGIRCNQKVMPQVNSPDLGHAQALLSAAVHKKLEEVRLLSLDWYMIEGSDMLLSLNPHFGCLAKRLEISLNSEGTTNYLKCPNNREDPLVKIIKLFPNVREVSLQFEYLSVSAAEMFWSLDQHLLFMTNRFLEIAWPSLDQISFSGIALNQTNLVTFLAAHKSKLQYAAFSNVLWCDELGRCVDFSYDLCRASLPAIRDAGYQGRLLYDGDVVC